MCLEDGCDELRYHGSKPRGYCLKHMPNRILYCQNGSARQRAQLEIVHRLKRDRRLRNEMLPRVAAEQNGMCAGFWTTEEVADGRAVNLCRWGTEKVPEWAQELDHIVPYAQTQDDSRETLQMLCACCHAGKTAAERGAALELMPLTLHLQPL